MVESEVRGLPERFWNNFQVTNRSGLESEGHLALCGDDVIDVDVARVL